MNIYIHIPFCNQKCSYCKFALTPIFDDFKKKKYLHFLEKEIIASLKKHPNKNIETIYFGGGTPSMLSPEEIEKILKIFPKGKKEISFEANPEDISEKYLEKIISLGINRISLGVQTLNNQALTAVERKNNTSIFHALNSIQNSILGQSCNISINVDFILGLPFVKKGEILNNITFLHEKYTFINHTSVYILEKGKYPENWQRNSISDGELYGEFQKICQFFQEKNWNHYEVSNFAKLGYECKHNIGYWNHTETLGFGLSSSGLLYSDDANFPYIRYTNSHSFSGYYKQTLIEYEKLSQEQIELEKFLFGIRTTGYQISENCDFLDENKIQDFLQEGLLNGTKNNFKISEKGIPIIDNIIEKILK